MIMELYVELTFILVDKMQPALENEISNCNLVFESELCPYLSYFPM